jgi:hypothetical protein
MIPTICDICGKEFIRKESATKRSKHHFCSRSCWGKWRSKEQTGIKNRCWQGGKIKKICEICTKEFELFPNYAKERKHIFCSQDCYQRWRIEQKQKYISICIVCGKPKQTTPSRLKKGVDKTCSKLCESILKSKLRIRGGNPNWNNGSSQEDYCPKFNKPFREGVRAIWKHTCGLCGKSQEENIVQCHGESTTYNLSVHHVHYIKAACCDGDRGNWHFIPLCAECHGKTNGHRKEYEQSFMKIIQDKQKGKSYLNESEYIEYFARKRVVPYLTVNEFLQSIIH